MLFINKFKKIKGKIKILYCLNKYGIKNYELIPDEEYGYIVNVNGNVYISNKNLKSIDIKFNKVSGHFVCSFNYLTSLKDFYCHSNLLKTLEGCPEVVGASFYCNNNQLESLEYSSEIINGNFNCSYNKLILLKGCPEIVNGWFDCGYNKLKTLEGSPKIIKGGFFCNNNELSIEGIKFFTKEINSNFINLVNNNKLGNLQTINDLYELRERIEDILKVKEEKNNILNNINKKKLKNNINKI